MSRSEAVTDVTFGPHSRVPAAWPGRAARIWQECLVDATVRIPSPGLRSRRLVEAGKLSFDAQTMILLRTLVWSPLPETHPREQQNSPSEETADESLDVG
jgi:hypothetical protein